MNCDHAHKVLDAYLDDELDEATAAQLAQHLNTCPACAGVRAERDALRTALRLLPRHEAPASLRRSIAGKLGAIERLGQPRRPPSLRWWQAAAFAGVAATAGLVLGLWIATPLAVEDTREHALARHVASLGNGQPQVEVISTDRHVVKPWFAGKLDFAPPVRDLTEHGVTLVGAGTEALAGRTAAVIVYRMRRHHVSLFVSRASGPRPQPIAASTLRGFAVVSWANAGLNFTAVSDTDLSELHRFADLLQAAGR